jgi:hypothetical protein
VAFAKPPKAAEARGRDEIIGEGKLLGTDLAFASEEVLQEKVQDLFERWERPGHSWAVFFWGEFADNLADISSWGMLGGNLQMVPACNLV